MSRALMARVGRRLIVAALAGAVLLAACGPKAPSGFTNIDPTYSGVLITATTSQDEGYGLIAQGGSALTEVTMSADSTLEDGNLRSSFFPAGQVPSESGRTCATWAGPNAPDDLPQQGLAARVETEGDRRAITVTKNIFGVDPATSVQQMNVNLWTIPETGASTLATIGTDFSAVVAPGGVLQPFPWRVCADVTGSAVVIDVATGASPPAPFTVDADERTVTLPDGWDYPGQFGWYIGHLHAGMTFTYDNLAALTPAPALPVAEPPTTDTTTPA